MLIARCSGLTVVLCRISLKGYGSRCWRSGSKPGCCRSGRTHRSSDSGCSYRRRSGRHRKRCSCSGRHRTRTSTRGMEIPLFTVTFLFRIRDQWEKGLTPPCFPTPFSTPKRCALKVIFGDGSRRWRSGPKPGSCRTGRTHRSTDSGCSNRRRTGRHRKRCSRSGRRCMCFHQGYYQQC